MLRQLQTQRRGHCVFAKISSAPTILAKTVYRNSVVGFTCCDDHQNQRASNTACNLCDHIGYRVCDTHAAGCYNAKCNCWVNVSARNGADAIWHTNQREAECKADASEANIALRYNRSAATK